MWRSFILNLATALLVALPSPVHSGSPATPPPGADLSHNEIRAALGLFNRYTSRKLPLLSRKQIDRLLAGEVVKIRQKSGTPDDPQSAVGYILIDEPRNDVWLAALDPHFLPVKKLREYEISSDGTGNSSWYQHFDLPWPVTDRHWIVDLSNDPRVNEGTRGKAWELDWNLRRGGEALARRLAREGKVSGVTAKMANEAIYTPVNEGAWVAINVRGERTLLAYHATTVVGGLIPDSIVLRIAMSALDELLYGVAERSLRMPAHYTRGHDPWPGGDGKPLPFH